MSRHHISNTYLVKLLLLLLISIPGLAQKKYEREYSLKTSAVPQQALAFVTGSFKNTKVHWYGEESLNGTTIEAKLKKSGIMYSVEFSADGKIQDIEILTRFDRLSPALQTAIKKRLAEEFKTFKVIKTQTQWTGSKEDLQQAINNEQLPAAIKVHYEMVVKGQKTGLSTYFEVLANDEGVVTSVREIIQRNSDNLIY